MNFSKQLPWPLVSLPLELGVMPGLAGSSRDVFDNSRDVFDQTAALGKVPAVLHSFLAAPSIAPNASCPVGERGDPARASWAGSGRAEGTVPAQCRNTRAEPRVPHRPAEGPGAACCGAGAQKYSGAG